MSKSQPNDRKHSLHERNGKEKDDKRSRDLNSFLAGGLAGMIAKTIVAPIERVKLLMQLSTNSIPHKSVGTVWTTSSRIYREEGFLAFWRGNTPNVIRQGGVTALNFMLMDRYKSLVAPIMKCTPYFQSSNDSASFVTERRVKLCTSFLSAGLAGGTASLLLYPIEFFRTRLAMDTGVQNRLYPRGTRDVLVSIYQADGIRGFFQGYGIALSGVVLYRALHLGGYDALKAAYSQKYHADSHQIVLRIHERFAIAQTVSIIAGTICYPIDSVRRRLMMQAGKSKNHRQYKDSIHAIRKILRQEGIKGFYLGLAPNIIRSVGAASILVLYDSFMLSLSPK